MSAVEVVLLHGTSMQYLNCLHARNIKVRSLSDSTQYEEGLDFITTIKPSGYVGISRMRGGRIADSVKVNVAYDYGPSFEDACKIMESLQ